MIFMKIKKEAFAYLQSFKMPVIVLLLVIGIGVFLNSISPIIYGNIIDSMTKKDMPIFVRLIVDYAVISAIVVMISCLEDYITQTLGSRVLKKHQQLLFNRILKTRMNDLEKIEIGQLISYLSLDLSLIVQYDIEVVTTIVFIIMNFFIPFVFIFFINIKLAITAIVFVPASYIIYLLFKKKKKSIHKKLQQLEDGYTSFTINCIRNASAIKAYKLESKISNYYNINTEKIRQVERRRSKVDSIVSLLNDSASTIFQIIFIVMTCALMLKNEITIGVFITFGLYVSRLFNSVQMMQKIQLSEQPVIVALERLENVMNATLEDYGNTEKNRSIKALQRLDINDITFSYDGCENILHHLSLSINDNGFYSIVGENGSGKSTILKLIMKFYEPNSGCLRLDDIPYNEYSVSSIRQYITYVEKEPFLLVNESILENIRLYDSDVDINKILKICESVGLTQFLEELSDRLDTIINEGMLSSGQIQKLSFARALAHPSPIMLFDEITSDLDGSSEFVLVNIMKDLGKTSIVLSISHRISAVVGSDKIYVLNDKNICDEGKFSYLYEHCKIFKKMFHPILSVS